MLGTRSRTWLNTAIYLGATVVTSLLGLLTALLMTHLLAPEQYGRIGILLSILYIAVPMVSLAAEGLIAVNRSVLDDKEYDRFRRTAVAIGLGMFMALQTVALLLWVTNILADELMLVVPVFALLRLATTMAATEYIVEKKAITYAVLTTLNSLLAMVLTYSLMTWLSASAGARVAALMVAESIILIVRYRGRMDQLLRPAFDAKYGRQIAMFGLPSLFALFGAWGLNESDKVVVAQGAGLAVAGLYTAASTLAAVMMSFNQSLTNSLFPGFFERLKARTESVRKLVIEYILKFFALNGVFALVVIAVYMLISESILPAKYVAASEYFYALIFANLAVAIFRPLSLTADYFKKARIKAIAINFGGAATIISAFIGIQWTGNPVWAAVGIALGYIVSAGILAISLNGFNADVLSRSTQ